MVFNLFRGKIFANWKTILVIEKQIWFGNNDLIIFHLFDFDRIPLFSSPVSNTTMLSWPVRPAVQPFRDFQFDLLFDHDEWTTYITWNAQTDTSRRVVNDSNYYLETWSKTVTVILFFHFPYVRFHGYLGVLILVGICRGPRTDPFKMLRWWRGQDSECMQAGAQWEGRRPREVRWGKGCFSLRLAAPEGCYQLHAAEWNSLKERSCVCTNSGSCENIHNLASWL